MRSRLLGLVVLAAVAIPIAATSGPYHPPRSAHGAGTIRPGTTVAFNAVVPLFPSLIPCPTECIGMIGHVTMRSAEGHMWQASVYCLAVAGTEAFMGLYVTEGDLLFVAAAYARAADPRELGPAPNSRFGLLRGVPFDCHSERIRTALRNHSQRLAGVVHVNSACEFCD